MKKEKTRRILAVIALVFMLIFSVSLVIVLASSAMAKHAVGWIALVSGLTGVGLFLVVRFVLKEKTPPEYLPADADGNRADPNADGNTDSASKETTVDSDGDGNTDAPE